MKEVVILDKEEYQELTKELRELRLNERDYEEIIKRVFNHDLRPEILLVDIDIKKLNKLFGLEENNEVIILEKK